MRFEEIKQKVETKREELYDEYIKDGKWKETTKKALSVVCGFGLGFALKAYCDNQKFNDYENQLEIEHNSLEDAEFESTCKSIRISQLEDMIVKKDNAVMGIISAGTREGSSTCARELNGRKQYLNNLRN